MKQLTMALAGLLIAAASPTATIAEVSCFPQAAGVGGVIADQKDAIAAINCLGQQIATVRNAMAAAERNQAARIDELARQNAALREAILGMQGRVDLMSNQIFDIVRPPAMPPNNP